MKEMTPEGKAAELVVKARELLVRLLPPSEYEENEDCAHLYDIIGELGHRTDNAGLYASIQSPTHEAVAVAWDWWKSKNRWKVASFDRDLQRSTYYVNVVEDKSASASQLFTMFTASPEYKELFK